MFSIFFATDLHGSTQCFRKFLKAKEFYNVDFLVLGGDWTGKDLRIIYKKNENEYIVSENSEVMDLNNLNEYLLNLERIGIYYHISEKDSREYSIDEREKLFKTYALKRLKQWIRIADEAVSGMKIPFILGNDDCFDMEDLFDSSNIFVNVDLNCVQFDEAFNIIGYAYSTPTPWNTPREKEDESIMKDLKSISIKENDLPLIFNIHVPPKGVGLDEVVRIDEKFEPKISSSGVEYIQAGSQSVFEFISKIRPELGLFGHIHEARGVSRVKETICINPGSIFSEGKLQGLVCTFKNRKLVSWQLTEG